MSPISDMSPINDWFVAPFSHHSYNHQNQYPQQQHQDNQATVFTNYYPTTHPTTQFSIEPTANNYYNCYLEWLPDHIKQEPMSVVSPPVHDSFYAAVQSSSSTQPPTTAFSHEQVLMFPNKMRRKYNSRRQFGTFNY